MREIKKLGAFSVLSLFLLLFFCAPVYAGSCKCLQTSDTSSEEMCYEEKNSASDCPSGTLGNITIVSCNFFSGANCQATSAETTPAVSDVTEDLQINKPVLEINIPQLQLSDADTELDEEGYMHLPWIGEYLSAIYKFGLIAISIVAVVLIILTGAKIIVSDEKEKNEGLKRVGQIVIGLFIAWGSYAILYNINPDLVTFKPLKVRYVEKIEVPAASITSSLTPPESDGTITSPRRTVPPDIYQRITGNSIPTREQIINMFPQVAQEVGLDICYLKAIIGKESGYRANLIGHDEDAPRAQVGSRPKFINTGRKSSGATFTPNNNLVTDGSFTNDDIINPDDSSNFGLDPRFTHGFGLGQLTITLNSATHEMNRCPDGKIGGNFGTNQCYNALQLLDARTNITVSAKLMKNKLQAAQRHNYPIPQGLFYYYAGSGCSARISQCRKMKEFANCKNNPALAAQERADCMTWLNENFNYCQNSNNR